MRARALCVLVLVGCHGGGGDSTPDGGANDTDETSETGETGETDEVVAPPLIVCADGGADFATIQEAVDAAESGAVIEVCPGTYAGALVVEGTPVTIRATDTTGTTVIDGGGDGPAVTVRAVGAPGVTIEGFTLQGGLAEVGGGVVCEDATVRLAALRITGNHAKEEGGGVGATRCALDLSASIVEHNVADDAGGGVMLSECTGSISDTLFDDNLSVNGGGLLVNLGEVEVSGNTFLGNRATSGLGGGAWLLGPHVFVGNALEANDAWWGGGGAWVGEGMAEVTDNVFTANTTSIDGAGLYVADGAPLVARNLFEDNVSVDDAGGIRGFFTNARFEENTFRRNVSGGDGGGMKASHAAPEIVGCVFEDNVSDGAGGGLEIDDNNAVVQDSTFLRNQAARGGGMHALEPYFDMVSTGLVFIENVASECGGGVALEIMSGSIDPPYTLEIRQTLFQANEAARGGAACTRDDSLVLRNVVIVDNVASDAGGGVYIQSAGGSLVQSVVNGNEAPTGAGVLFSNPRAFAISGSIVSDNVGGAGIKYTGTTGVNPTIAWSDIWGGTGFDGLRDVTGLDGNQSIDPEFLDAGAGDFHLSATSPLIDAGDPTQHDADGSRADVGAFGGPNGSW